MKLDKIKFVMLCVKLQSWFNDGKQLLSQYDIEELESFIDIKVVDKEVQHDYTSATDINTLMMLMAEGTRKIEAIKMHRKLTGYGLKESKEEVEKYWVSKGHYQSDANLGDILEQATKK